MRSVADILKRKPVIWDNLHASDYDAKRIHLGPFTGRLDLIANVSEKYLFIFF